MPVTVAANSRRASALLLHTVYGRPTLGRRVPKPYSGSNEIEVCFPAVELVSMNQPLLQPIQGPMAALLFSGYTPWRGGGGHLILESEAWKSSVDRAW